MFFKVTRQLIVSILTPCTESSNQLNNYGSISSSKVYLDKNSGKDGMNYIVASLTLHVLSFESLMISGKMWVLISSSESEAINFLTFYRRDTLTSVAESFNIAITGGNTYSIVSSLERHSPSSQIENAMLPFTC